MGYYNNRPKTSIERIRDAVEDIDGNITKEVFYVAFSVTTESDVDTWATDKTASEIIEAAKGGALVVGVLESASGASYMNLLGYSETDGEATFQEWDVDTVDTLTLRQWLVGSDSVTKTEYYVTASSGT